jgi:hypothetical protein
MAVPKPSHVLRHVRQRRRMDCMIATAATISRTTYEQCAFHAPAKTHDRGMYPREIRALLHHVTGIEWTRPGFAWWRPLIRLAAYSCPVVITIRRPSLKTVLHCIAIDGQWVHDPGYAYRMTLDRYDRNMWRVMAVYRPKTADQFVTLLAERERQSLEEAVNCQTPIWP